MKIKIKPLSINEAWKGRHFKTKKYLEWERELFYILPPLKIPEGKLSVTIVWGLSSKGGDIDNPTKPFLDVLQKKYKFNDKDIYELTLIKQIVKKGAEYIDFFIF